MEELINYIDSQLSEVHPRSSYLETEGGTVMPYIVWRWDNGSPDQHDLREDFVITINIWGNDNQAQEVDALTESIKNKFRRMKWTGDNVSVRFEYLSRMPIPDPLESLERREVRFLAKTYFI
jgi:hypothetical protein